MEKERIEGAIKVLRDIANDMGEDAKRFDGQPFTGKTVAEYFGCHGAAIAALAGIIRMMLVQYDMDHKRKLGK